jgi:hypothetical protein
MSIDAPVKSIKIPPAGGGDEKHGLPPSEGKFTFYEFVSIQASHLRLHSVPKKAVRHLLKSPLVTGEKTHNDL